MTPPAARKTLILDRDGTIVFDRDYLADPAGLEWLPGAADALRSLHQRGYRLIVITNQSGVGRGMFSLSQLQQMNLRLQEMASACGAHLERIYYCPHRPEDHCECRKPAPALLHQAAREFGFDPADAVVIGDKSSDIELGRRVGALTIRIAPAQHALPTPAREADYVVASLLEAVSILDTLLNKTGTTTP